MKLRDMAIAATAMLLGFSSTALADTQPSSAEPSSDVTWMVFGIQPDFVRVDIGKIAKSIFGTTIIDTNFFRDYRPVDGYVVIKVKSGQLYAFGAIVAAYGILRSSFLPCGRVKTYRATPGKVLYFGDTTYNPTGASVVRSPFGPAMRFAFEETSHSQDIEAARAYLKTHYPNLSDSLEQGQTEAVDLGNSCNS